MGASPTCRTMTKRADEFEELAKNAYNEGGLARMIAVVIDAATTKQVRGVTVKEAKFVIESLKTHCEKQFALSRVYANGLATLQPLVRDFNPDDVLVLCRYYNERKDFNWAKEKMGLPYLVKNIQSDMSKAMDWMHGEPDDDTRSKVR